MNWHPLYLWLSNHMDFTILFLLAVTVWTMMTFDDFIRKDK
jgi:hypothetical protein